MIRIGICPNWLFVLQLSFAIQKPIDFELAYYSLKNTVSIKANQEEV